MQYPDPQDIYNKLQNSAVALLPFLYKEAVFHLNESAVKNQIIQEDKDNAVKLYRKNFHTNYIEEEKLETFLFFPRGLYFEELDFSKLIRVFIHFRVLSNIIVQYFDSNADKTSASEFMYSKAKLLLEYRNRLSGHNNLKNMVNQSNYTYNFTNAINDLLAFVNFFNTTKDIRFKKEISLMNQYAIKNLYGLPNRGGNIINEENANNRTQTRSEAEYIALRKSNAGLIEKKPNNVLVTSKNKKKSRKLLWIIGLITIGAAVIAYFGAKYGFQNIINDIRNSGVYRFIENILKIFKKN